MKTYLGKSISVFLSRSAALVALLLIGAPSGSAVCEIDRSGEELSGNCYNVTIAHSYGSTDVHSDNCIPDNSWATSNGTQEYETVYLCPGDVISMVDNTGYDVTTFDCGWDSSNWYDGYSC